MQWDRTVRVKVLNTALNTNKDNNTNPLENRPKHKNKQTSSIQK